MAYSHLLISRPVPEASELATLANAAGLVAIQIPAFSFEPEFPGLDFNAAWVPDVRRLAIFSSTRAVEFGLRQLPAGFFETVEIAAIGPATADALESAGHAVSIVPGQGYNSESLLEHPALATEPGHALIFAAPGGRQALFTGLQNLGWSVVFAHVYRAAPLDPDPEAISDIMASKAILSVWTSANALRHLSAKIDKKAWKMISRGDFLVTSPRLGKIAAGYTDSQVIVTDGPGNEAIARSILQLI
jgi:uroporphyrinogen-III synthase